MRGLNDEQLAWLMHSTHYELKQYFLVPEHAAEVFPQTQILAGEPIFLIFFFIKKFDTNVRANRTVNGISTLNASS
jgi:hypothetical protein